MNGAALLLLGCTGPLAAAIVALRAHREKRRDQRRLGDRLTRLGPPPSSGAASQAPVALDLPSWLPAWLSLAMRRADFVPNRRHLRWSALGMLALAAFLGTRLGWPAGLALLATVAVALPLALRIVAARRINALVDSLPFYFDAIRQMLMAGTALQQAIARASDNTQPSVQRYLGPMVRRIQNGAAVNESIGWLAARLDVAELHMFAVAVQANVQYGGRLSTVLANLTGALRDRGRVIRELRSATAETRVSAMLLGALPTAAGLLMGVFNPGYATFFLHDPVGHEMLAVAACLQLAAIGAMRRLMRIDY